MRRVIAAVALPGLMALGGCSLFSSDADLSPLLVCPDAYRVLEAASLVRFKPGPGKDPIDILFQAEVGTLETSCRFNAKRGYVDVDLKVQLRVAQGPASTLPKASFEYAVGVLGPGGAQMERRHFSTDVTFQTARSRGALTDQISVRLPYNSENGAAGYRIAVGLVLTPEEIDYNRRAAAGAAR